MLFKNSITSSLVTAMIVFLSSSKGVLLCCVHQLFRSRRTHGTLFRALASGSKMRPSRNDDLTIVKLVVRVRPTDSTLDL